MRKVTIGLGSGRCGTTTLTHLFNCQQDSIFTHEYFITDRQTFRWNKDAELVLPSLIKILLNNARFVGDVGYYWINYIPFIVSAIHDVRFVCLKRDMNETIKSFINVPVSTYFVENISENPRAWAFPKYDLPYELAIEQYYDEYYEMAEKFEKLYPKLFRIFPMDKLNSKEGQKEILDFAGFKNHNYCVGVKLNKGGDIADNSNKGMNFAVPNDGYKNVQVDERTD